MKRNPITPTLTLLSLGILLVGCSATNRMAGWFAGGDSDASEVAYVPPSTAAPLETKVYQSQSYGSAKDATPKTPSDWGFEGIEPEPESVSIFEQPVGDIGYVNAGSPTLSGNPTYTTVQQPSTTPGVFRGGNAAPRVYGKTFDGQVFDSAQHRGKVVLVDFWFRECGPCVRALPQVDKLRSAYSKDQLTIVAVNNDRRKSTATAFLQRNPHDWPQIYDKEQRTSLVDAYGVKLFPTFVVIDQLGNVQYQGSSITTASAKVDELIRTPSIPATAAPVGVVASGNRPG